MKRRQILWAIVLGSMLAISGCGEDNEGAGNSAGSGASGGTGGMAGTGGTAGTGGMTGTGGMAGTGGMGGNGGTMARQGFESCMPDNPGNECECDPFQLNLCQPDEQCVVVLRDLGMGEYEVPALDGSNVVEATACLDEGAFTANPIGFACTLSDFSTGTVFSQCTQGAVCVDGECLRACRMEGSGVAAGCDGFDVCDFRFGDGIAFGACVSP